jgi:hypothetical protein
VAPPENVRALGRCGRSLTGVVGARQVPCYLRVTDRGFGPAEPNARARQEDDAALVATVVCRRGVAADLRAGSTRGCGWWDRGDRPASARVEPRCSGGGHLLVQRVVGGSVARFTRGGLRCRVRCTWALPLGALGARLAAVATGSRRAGRCGRSATAGLDCRGGSRLRCPPPTGKLAVMIASNSACRSPASAQMRSANASEVPLVVASRCPRAARSGVGWSVMAAALPVVPGRDGVRR